MVLVYKNVTIYFEEGHRIAIGDLIKKYSVFPFIFQNGNHVETKNLIRTECKIMDRELKYLIDELDTLPFNVFVEY